MMSELRPFLFDGLPVRGMLVRLTGAWQELLRRRREAGANPPEVSALLGEITAAAVLMQANIKFNGALVIQIFGDGPVKLAVAEVQPDLAFRATAKVVGDAPAGAGLEALLNVHGQGRCAITLDPTDKRPGQQPYQGVVPLHGDRREPLQNLSEVLEHYMLQSEQLDTRMILAAWPALGLLLDRITNSDVPYLDALATVGSITGTILLGRKLIENWWVWLAVNLFSVGLFVTKGLWLTVLLYALFAALSVAGWRAWRVHVAPAHA